MTTKSDLVAAAFAVAEEWRSGAWPALVDDGGGPRWRATWERLLAEVAGRCPGFTPEAYHSALEAGLRDSR